MDTVQHQITIPEELQGKRLDQALAQLFPDYSRSRIKEWILAGHVTLDGEQPAPRSRVDTGQQVILNAAIERPETVRPQPMELNVVFEDDAVLVIDKPAGLVVHPGTGNLDGTLVNGLLDHVSALAALPRSGLLHRLDKDTSGLLLVAKTVPAHTRLVRDLQERRIAREYRGICEGRLTAGGHIDAPIGRHPTQRTRMAVVTRGRPSVTHYRILERFPAHTYLAIRLETGRTHQIRVHMAHLHHALFGDPVYGQRLKIPAGMSPECADVLRSFARQALHACRLAFEHPLEQRSMKFVSALPADLTKVLQAMAGSDKRTARFDEMKWPEQQRTFS